MAYRPSKRMHHEEEGMEPFITPMMNLMVVLIPLLLSTAEFVRLGFIEINLPPEVSESAEQAVTLDEGDKLNLAITVTDRGFYLSSTLGVSGDREGPTIPKQVRDGTPQYNYQALSDSLYQMIILLDSGEGSMFTDTNQIIIIAEPDVRYEVIVKTMAAARAVIIRDNGQPRSEPLFENISLSPPRID
jgi:biopolymer transport protein ExbD